MYLRPSIPVDPVVREIIADAVLSEQPHGELLVKAARLGARALLPGEPADWPDLPASADGKPRVYRPLGPNFVPEYNRSFRPGLHIEPADAVRLEYIPRVVQRHPKEGWYLSIAVGWALMNGRNLSPEVADTAWRFFACDLAD